MILFFSGTGNSRYIARRLAAALGDELVSVNDRIKSGDTGAVRADGRLIFVTPTYGWRIPRVVEEWIRRVEFSGADQGVVRDELRQPRSATRRSTTSACARIRASPIWAPRR